MMYWAGVYILVAVGVAIPFILLYIVAGALWLAFQAVRSIWGSNDYRNLMERR